MSTISTRIIIAAVIAVLAMIACALYTIRLLRRRRQQRHADVVADRALHAMYTYLTLMLGTPQSQTTMQDAVYKGREQYDILYNAADSGGYFQREDHDERAD